MSARTFHVARPDQLQTLVKYAKTNAPTVARTARIWDAARKKNGETRWYKGVFVGFSGDRKRMATLYRVTTYEELVEFATLRYNLALLWCERNLRQV